MKHEHKLLLTRIVLAALFLLLALFLPLKGIWKLLVFLLSYLLVGYDVIKEAVENILQGEVFDEEFLMTIATVGALILGEYAEAAAVMLFYQIGELFGEIAEEKSRNSITALMDLRPDTAAVLKDGTAFTVPVEDVAIGETIVVRPGERVPLDGIVTKGTSSVNTAALTGESLPRDVTVGCEILSGCVNLSGLIEIRVTALSEESTAAKILSLIEDAADRKSKSETFLRKFAKIYTPCVVIAAVLLALLPLLFGGQWLIWLRRALVFLVASCPCALLVSVPLAFFGAIGGASKHGILIKGAEYIERIAKLRTLVFDKTGTLTKGSFTASKILPNGCTEDELLSIAAAAELASTHPIALCLVKAAENFGVQLTASSVTEHAGYGIEAVINGNTYFVGNGKLMDRAGAAYAPLDGNGTAVYICEGTKYLGGILISDELKEDAKSAVAELQNRGLATVMLTGDRQVIADSVAKELNIGDTYAELLPADKVQAVEQLLSKETPTAFVGDGLNDAPVLMRADVGIAMGAYGSEAAMEAADVVLLNDTLGSLPLLHSHARKTMRIVRENIIFALAAKLAVLVLSAVGILTLYGMWIAVFADVGVMVLSVLNALRTFSVKT